MSDEILIGMVDKLSGRPAPPPSRRTESCSNSFSRLKARYLARANNDDKTNSANSAADGCVVLVDRVFSFFVLEATSPCFMCLEGKCGKVPLGRGFPRTWLACDLGFQALLDRQ